MQLSEQRDFTEACLNLIFNFLQNPKKAEVMKTTRAHTENTDLIFRT
jgi:pantoate kinase